MKVNLIFKGSTSWKEWCWISREWSQLHCEFDLLVQHLQWSRSLDLEWRILIQCLLFAFAQIISDSATSQDVLKGLACWLVCSRPWQIIGPCKVSGNPNYWPVQNMVVVTCTSIIVNMTAPVCSDAQEVNCRNRIYWAWKSHQFLYHETAEVAMSSSGMIVIKSASLICLRISYMQI